MGKTRKGEAKRSDPGGSRARARPARSHTSSHRRIVAVGDLNGSAEALLRILRGTGVIDRRGHWAAGDTHLVQVGDLFNRGDSAREACLFLGRLGIEAREAGGDVTVLLGNHEVMTALGNESYCTVGEYLSFATTRERFAWEKRVRAMHLKLHREPAGDHGRIPPVLPRLEVWKIDHVPGRLALRRAFAPGGHIGRPLRRFPVAAKVGDTVFVHGGLSTAWARLGIDGLNRAAEIAWRKGPDRYLDLPKHSVLRHADGPLWNRVLARGPSETARPVLETVLERLDARRMVVGHTQTARVPGGHAGRIAMRFRSRLVCIDVGIGGDPSSPLAALIIEDGVGREWTPGGIRELWHDTPAAGSSERDE